jgi:hypothetical protein
VAHDKAYCVYFAESEADILDRADGQVPANRISRVKTMIDPSSAN